MSAEKRQHRRIIPNGLKANILVNQRADEEMALNGEILDISLTGIRIKLKEPLHNPDNGKVKITLILPESGAPFTVHGILKHQPSNSEYGVHYTNHAQGSIDDLMFECVKLTEETLFIKTA